MNCASARCRRAICPRRKVKRAPEIAAPGLEVEAERRAEIGNISYFNQFC
jgi:hypothetical protein